MIEETQQCTKRNRPLDEAARVNTSFFFKLSAHRVAPAGFPMHKDGPLSR